MVGISKQSARPHPIVAGVFAIQGERLAREGRWGRALKRPILQGLASGWYCVIMVTRRVLR